MTFTVTSAVTSAVLVTGVAAAVTAGVLVGAGAPASPAGQVPDVRMMGLGTPLPLDPAVAVLPTADQLTGVLTALANPGVPFANKSYLVEGGIGRIEARTADALMRNAVAKGQLPLTFTIADIAPAGPGAASANVTASGPTMPSATQNITFVDQGGWKLSRQSASAVLALFSS